ncbi:MAG: hypothetical protein KBG40_08400 [Bacteroidales bacterium]|nr:hypothetical protein [Bacteroidales bacterium]
MKKSVLSVINVVLVLFLCQADVLSAAQDSEPRVQSHSSKIVVPVIVNGEAQKILEFENPKEWIQHDLWVETEFDSDGDGRSDRMHVDVTRPKQTETDGIKLPVIYESSPYYAGIGSTEKQYFWNMRHELNTVPPPRNHMPLVERKIKRPVISTSLTTTWVPEV